PDQSVLIAIHVAELLRVLAEFIGDVNLFAAGAIAAERDPFTVRRSAWALLLPGRFADTLGLSAIRCNGAALAMRDDGGAPDRRRDREALRLGDRHQLLFVLLGIDLDIDHDFGALAAGCVQLPEAEVVFVDDDFAVGGNRWEKEIAICVVSDLCFLAAFI